MDLDDDIINLARSGGPKALRQAVAEVKAVYGVPETRAYAMVVRAAARRPVEMTDTRPEPRAHAPQQRVPLFGG